MFSESGSESEFVWQLALLVSKYGLDRRFGITDFFLAEFMLNQVLQAENKFKEENERVRATYKEPTTQLAFKDDRELGFYEDQQMCQFEKCTLSL